MDSQRPRSIVQENGLLHATESRQCRDMLEPELALARLDLGNRGDRQPRGLRQGALSDMVGFQQVREHVHSESWSLSQGKLELEPGTIVRDR
jgi:hypothetical protein